MDTEEWIDVLGKLNDEQATLLLALGVAWLPYPYGPEACLEALGETPTAAAVEAIIPWLDDDWARLSPAAARILARAGTPPAMEALRSGLLRERASHPCALALADVGDAEALSALCAGMESHDAKTREACSDGLWDACVRGRRSTRAPTVIQALCRGLDDEDRDVQMNCARALCNARARSAAPALLRKLLHDSDSHVRGFCAEALARTGDPAGLEALFRGVDSADADLRHACAGGLGLAGGPEVMRRLCEGLLHDSSPPFRHACAWALEKLADPASLDVLCQCLRSEDHTIGRACANALAKIGDARAVRELCQGLDDAVPEVRYNCALALSRWAPPPDPRGESRLAAALCRRLADDPSPRLRSLCVESLGKVGGPKALDALCRALREDEDAAVREKCLEALRELDDPGAEQSVLEAMHRREGREKESCFWTFVQVGGPDRLVGGLCQAVKKGDPPLLALRALEKVRQRSGWRVLAGGEVERP